MRMVNSSWDETAELLRALLAWDAACDDSTNHTKRVQTYQALRAAIRRWKREQQSGEREE